MVSVRSGEGAVARHTAVPSSLALESPRFDITNKTMKFQQLPMGARFEYEGKVYTKTGPIQAAAESGGQRVIPRFAVLKPLDEKPKAEAPRRGRKLDEAAVMAAFEAFCAECADLPGAAAERAAALASARQRFLAALK